MVCNADMQVGEIRQFCKLHDEGQSLMRAAMTQLNLSARAYHRTRSVKLASMFFGHLAKYFDVSLWLGQFWMFPTRFGVAEEKQGFHRVQNCSDGCAHALLLYSRSLYI